MGKAIILVCVDKNTAQYKRNAKVIEQRMIAARRGMKILYEYNLQTGSTNPMPLITELARCGEFQCLLVDHPATLDNLLEKGRSAALRKAYGLACMGVTVEFSEDHFFDCRPPRAVPASYWDKEAFVNSKEYAEYHTQLLRDQREALYRCQETLWPHLYHPKKRKKQDRHDYSSSAAKQNQIG